MTNLQECLATARSLAQEAADEVLQMRHVPLEQERKEDRSLVTAADLASDRIIREGLLKAFPHHAVLTEEQGLLGTTSSEFVWLVDPLDGTKAYAKGISGFCVMIGLLKTGTPCLGVVVDPLEGFVYEAVIGEGAYVSHHEKRQPLRVSDRSNWEQMPLVISTGFPETSLAKARRHLTGPVLDPINSVGIKVGLLVRQEADIYLNHHSVHLWDTCAPQAILEEAGGAFTRLDGEALSYEIAPPYSHRSRTIASNGRRHSDLIDLMQGIF